MDGSNMDLLKLKTVELTQGEVDILLSSARIVHNQLRAMPGYNKDKDSTMDTLEAKLISAKWSE